MVLGQLPPEENCPPSPPTVSVGVLVKVRVSFRVGATRQLPWSKIPPWLALEFVLVLLFGLGGNCPRASNYSYKNFNRIFGFFETVFFSTFHSAFNIIVYFVDFNIFYSFEDKNILLKSKDQINVYNRINGATKL